MSRWAILMLGNHKKWGVAGGLGALGILFFATQPNIRPILCFGVLVQIAQFLGLFGAFLGRFLGHIVQSEGTKGFIGRAKVKPHVKCSSRLPSFGCFEAVLGLFWAKNGCFWPKTAQIWEGTSRLSATAPGRHR